MTADGETAPQVPLNDVASSSKSRQSSLSASPTLGAQGSKSHPINDLHNGQEAERPTALSNNNKKKKNRRKGKSLASRGPTALPRNRGTGFEEYFADPPMTPSEASEEKYFIYAEELSFEERIQSCIQRYRSRRRLQPDQTRFFDEYLFLGGIDTTANAFIGVDPTDLKGMTPAQRREAMAFDTVHGGSAAGERFYTGETEHWSVDFAGVAAGFFSIALWNISGGEPEGLEKGIALVENFLRYILHHDVCPEYEESVKQALQACTLARVEWPMVTKLRTALPGQFNLAASRNFSQHDDDDWSRQSESQVEKLDSAEIFFSSLALIEEGEVWARTSVPGVKVAHQFFCTLQIEQIIRPSEDIVTRFKQLCLDRDRADIPPLGKILCKVATIEDGWDHPVVPSPLKSDEEVILYFDDAVLAYMRHGQKMTATLCELDSGLRFVKTIRHIVPTFYTFLPQELMRHFKVPREDDRPAPSIHSPAVGDDEDADGEKLDE